MGDPTLVFPQHEAARLEPYLPQTFSGSTSTATAGEKSSLPFVTLTFATSLDSAIALAPGTRTALSGSQSKAMTHYLRSRHDAICVGVGTAVADDPGLNSRLLGVGNKHHPRPIVLDPQARWNFSSSSKVLQLAGSGKGKAPFIVTATGPRSEKHRSLLEGLGGKYIKLQPEALIDGRFRWEHVLRAVRAEGLRSIMVEGGGEVINSLLEPQNANLVDTVIVTIAPTWLGQGGVVVSPTRRLDADGQPIAATRLTNTCWIPLGMDVVLCGRFLGL
jgi:2,5-diamino-6-(ribosylamino)-4(3H)-pyrimidinone 5'-phosphate reductase